MYRGKMYSLNNKHLFALRKQYGHSRNIHVHVVPFREAKHIFYKKFTSSSDGRNCTLIKRDESSGSLEYYITDRRAKKIFEDDGFGKIACSVVLKKVDMHDSICCYASDTNLTTITMYRNIS